MNVGRYTFNINIQVQQRIISDSRIGMRDNEESMIMPGWTYKLELSVLRFGSRYHTGPRCPAPCTRRRFQPTGGRTVSHCMARRRYLIPLGKGQWRKSPWCDLGIPLGSWKSTAFPFRNQFLPPSSGRLGILQLRQIVISHLLIAIHNCRSKLFFSSVDKMGNRLESSNANLRVHLDLLWIAGGGPTFKTRNELWWYGIYQGVTQRLLGP